MKKFVVITSIFEPTEAVVEFSKLQDLSLIVVGDKKSPAGWQNNNTLFLSVEDQLYMDSELAKQLPFNHYCRKMVGYLHAAKNGAEIIIDTDDDNIPKENWNFPDFEGEYDTITADKGFINIYTYYTKHKIWPRGLPLQLINRKENTDGVTVKPQKVGVWQGLADEDPDVDAIYRLTSDEWVNFEDRNPLVLDERTFTPFNSQNTAFIKELFPLLYLPSLVTFRFTDILRGIVAQPVMWSAGYKLGFTNATVVQKRNPHDYVKDFISEIPMYLNIEKAAEIAQEVASADNSVQDNLFNIYKKLETHDIVVADEIKLVEAWLKDLSN